MVFVAFKSQNFEKIYKIKIMQFYIWYNNCLFLVTSMYSLRSVQKSCRKNWSLTKKAVGRIATLNVGRIATLSVGRTEVYHGISIF